MNEITVKVGQTWRHNGGAELRVGKVMGMPLSGEVAFFERRDGSTAKSPTRRMTPANGWELVQDLAPADGLPTYWRSAPAPAPEEWCTRCGYSGHSAPACSMTPALIQDAPEAAPRSCDHTRTCGDEDCARCDAWTPEAVEPACVCGAQAVGWYEGHCISHCPLFGTRAGSAWAIAHAPAPKPDPCAAALDALPVSGEFVESRQNDALEDWRAEADLRRRLSTLRTWPTCPKDGTPYEVEAFLRVDTRWHHYHDDEPGETLRVWTARCVCRACGGGR